MTGQGPPQSGVQKCPSQYSRHLWYRHGGYRTAAGEWQARERCFHCKLVRPAGGKAANRKRGPVARGVPGSPAFRDFWETLIRRYPAIGLAGATTEAAAAAGVSTSTARRWVLTPLPEGMPSLRDVPLAQLRLLEAALLIRDVRRPEMSGLDRWQRLRSEAYGTYDDDYHENTAFREHGPAFWQAFLRAAAVAGVVRGEGMCAALRDLVPTARDTWMTVLDHGGLNRTGRSGGVLDCWLTLDDSSFTVVLGTRRRTVGTAAVVAGSWRPMTVRVRLDKAEYSSGTVVLPVPAATQRSKRGTRDYPLILTIPEAATWWDLDDPTVMHSPFRD